MDEILYHENYKVPKTLKEGNSEDPCQDWRTMIGCGVPHFRLANSFIETKYTSHGKGGIGHCKASCQDDIDQFLE